MRSDLHIFMHAWAMLALVLFLLAGAVGGSEASVAGRAAYVASRLWLWRVG